MFDLQQEKTGERLSGLICGSGLSGNI